jgi:hypothetical protein
MIKHLVTSTIGILLAIGSSDASPYEWAGGKHGCITEKAGVSLADLSSHSSWVNAPRTFFVTLTPCKEANSESPPDDFAVFAKLGCAAVLENSENYFDVSTEKLRNFPHAWDLVTVDEIKLGLPVRGRGHESSLMKLMPDGSVQFGAVGETNAGQHAWFMLHASCSPF